MRLKLFAGAKQALITVVTGILISLIAFSYVRYIENQDAHEALENEAYNVQREIRQNLVAHLFATELSIEPMVLTVVPPVRATMSCSRSK